MKGRSVLGGVPQVTASLRTLDVIDEHVTDGQLPIGAADQVVSELERDDLRDILVFGDRPDFLLAERAQVKAILEPQHRRLLSPTSALKTNSGTGSAEISLTWIKAGTAVTTA